MTEQEHLDKLESVKTEIELINKQTHKAVARAQKYHAKMRRLDKSSGVFACFSWLRAYKKRQEAIKESKELLSVSEALIESWNLLAEDYKLFLKRS